MTKKAAAPSIRFKGFSDAWEQRKLSEIADKVTEKNAGLQYVETFTNSAEFGIISQRDFFDHDIAKLGSLDGYYIVKNEDFVYNPRISTSAPVGPINRNKLGRTGVMSPLYTVFRPHDVDTTYLEHFFKCAYWHSFMNFNGDSGARSDRFSIKDDVFFQMPIPLPYIDEQRKIGELLTRLDHLITLHQRKYEKLTNVKKSMLEKMFPQNGSSYPEIRFKGFTDPWEQRKVGDFYDFKNGLNKGKAFFGKGTPIVNFTDVFHKRGITTQMLRGRVTLTPSEISNYGVKQGDIFVTRTSETIEEIGYASVMLDSPKDTVFSGFVLRGRAIKEDPLTLKFKQFVFSTDAFRSEMIKKSSMTTRALTSGTAIKKMYFQYPVSTEEQNRIGQFLESLDHLITLHQRELEKLQNIKKSMLEKMFV